MTDTTIILNDYEMSRTHGTGAQLLRTFGTDGPYLHLYWHCGHGGQSETTRSVLMRNACSTIPYTRRLVDAVQQIPGLGWWHEDEVNRGRLRRLLRRRQATPRSAYVVAASEGSARRALSILRYLNCPYVLHVMDVIHVEGITREHTPEFVQLTLGASRVIAINDAIAGQLRPFTTTDVLILLPGHPIRTEIAAPPEMGRPVRVILIGNSYPGGCDLLATAVDLLALRGIAVDMMYVGGSPERISPRLRGRVRNLGFVSDDHAFFAALATAHIGFLSGPNDLDAFGRFSFPSRCGDYLLSGLPIVAAVPPSSATEQVLASIVPVAARLSMTAEGIANAIAAFGTDAAAWAAASDLALAFARAEFDIHHVRNYIFEAINAAVSARPGSTGFSL